MIKNKSIACKVIFENLLKNMGNKLKILQIPKQTFVPQNIRERFSKLFSKTIFYNSFWK